MNTKKRKSHRKRSRWAEGIFSRNPIFIRGLALPFAIMMTASLKTAAAISILQACSLLPTLMLIWLVGRYLPRWATLSVAAIFSMVVTLACMPLARFVSPTIYDQLGIYIPILSVNSLLGALCCRHSAPDAPPLPVLADAACYSIGFTLALAIMAAIRELIAYGTLWNLSIALPFRMPGLSMAFSGFLLIGLFGALFRAVSRCYNIRLFHKDNPPVKEGSK